MVEKPEVLTTLQTVTGESAESEPQLTGAIMTGSLVSEPWVSPPLLGLDQRIASYTTAGDLEWLFDGSFSLSPEFDRGMDVPCLEQEFLPPGDSAAVDSITGNQASPPIFDERSTNREQKTYQRCAWRVCNAMTEDRRLELLLAMRDRFETKVLTSETFSLDSLKAGVHFYSKYIHKEYCFFNPRILFPEADEQGYISKYYGEEAPSRLAWAIITLGWMLLHQEEPNTEQIKAARTIQRDLRTSVMSIIATTASPSLWVIQTLFLVLLFARYHGEAQEFGTAPILHGVLVNLVRRLDLSGISHLERDECQELTVEDWFKWIKAESIKRIVIQTFVLDVQQTILFGASSSMSAFEINLDLPCGEEAWTADTLSDWQVAMQARPQKPPLFLDMLKQFWNLPRNSKSVNIAAANPGDARAILNGVVSIASETWRRHQDAFASRPSDKDPSVSSRIMASFQRWMFWWNGAARQFRVERFDWRNCACFYRLAHTLCEVTSSDLQIVAGKATVEGRHVRANDYAKGRRRIRSWASTAAASVAVSETARMIMERLTVTDPHSHCHHCNWSLYLAGLVLWNYVFARNDKAGSMERPLSIIDTITSLHQFIGLGDAADERTEVGSINTIGILARIRGVLDAEPSGIIEEALVVLDRLTCQGL